jgi:predicted flavoprotein YhiN
VAAPLRDALEAHGQAEISLDLAPGREERELEARLERWQGKRSLASVLEKAVRLKGVNAGLLREFAPPADLRDPKLLAGWIKHLPVPILSPRPLEEAISSAGGVRFEAVDERLMLKALPGVFCAGEMLDWEAPTGGYLLTGCFATGRAAGLGVASWLEARRASSSR